MKNNIYLLYGTDSFLLDLELNKIISNTDPINIVKYNLDDNTINEIIDDAQTLSLFDSHKTIIVKNSNIFTNKKNEIEQDPKILEEYLNNPNPNTVLIFLVEIDKIDSRKKVCKLIEKVGEIKKVEKPKNIHKFIVDSFGKYKIDKESINLLIERVGENLSILSKEIEKLKIYKEDDFNITKDDILKVTSKNIQPDIYHFIECIINKDVEKAYTMYKELRTLNEEPIAIIALLSNKFRLIYQANILYQRGYTIDDIANTLGSHPYPVKLALEKGRAYSRELLLDYIEKLADLDFNIKAGLIDKELGLELFILNI